MSKTMRIWAKIAAVISIIVTIDQATGIFMNYTLYAYTSPWFWLYLAVKTLPLLAITIPLFYYGFKKD